VSNNVGLIVWIKRVRFVSGRDLVLQLIAPKLDAASRIEFSYVNPRPFLSEMLGYTPEIFNAELLAKSKDAVNQDNIHPGG
jgi:hypothetical protein